MSALVQAPTSSTPHTVAELLQRNGYSISNFSEVGSASVANAPSRVGAVLLGAGKVVGGAAAQLFFSEIAFTRSVQGASVQDVQLKTLHTATQGFSALLMDEQQFKNAEQTGLLKSIAALRNALSTVQSDFPGQRFDLVQYERNGTQILALKQASGSTVIEVMQGLSPLATPPIIRAPSSPQNPRSSPQMSQQDISSSTFASEMPNAAALREEAQRVNADIRSQVYKFRKSLQAIEQSLRVLHQTKEVSQTNFKNEEKLHRSFLTSIQQLDTAKNKLYSAASEAMIAGHLKFEEFESLSKTLFSYNQETLHKRYLTYKANEYSRTAQAISREVQQGQCRYGDNVEVLKQFTNLAQWFHEKSGLAEFGKQSAENLREHYVNAAVQKPIPKPPAVPTVTPPSHDETEWEKYQKEHPDAAADIEREVGRFAGAVVKDASARGVPPVEAARRLSGSGFDPGAGEPPLKENKVGSGGGDNQNALVPLTDRHKQNLRTLLDRLDIRYDEKNPQDQTVAEVLDLLQEYELGHDKNAVLSLLQEASQKQPPLSVGKFKNIVEAWLASPEPVQVAATQLSVKFIVPTISLRVFESLNQKESFLAGNVHTSKLEDASTPIGKERLALGEYGEKVAHFIAYEIRGVIKVLPTYENSILNIDAKTDLGLVVEVGSRRLVIPIDVKISHWGQQRSTENRGGRTRFDEAPFGTIAVMNPADPIGGLLNLSKTIGMPIREGAEQRIEALSSMLLSTREFSSAELQSVFGQFGVSRLSEAGLLESTEAGRFRFLGPHVMSPK